MSEHATANGASPSRWGTLWAQLQDDRILAVAGSTLICVHLLVAMEWLFAVTKPSFLASVSTPTLFVLLLAAPMPIILAVVFPAVALRLIALRIARPAAAQTLRWAACTVAGFLITVTALLVADNFTYNTMGFGIGTTGPAGRAAYSILLVALLVYCTRRLATWEKRIDPMERHRLRILVPLLALLPLGTTLVWGLGTVWRPSDLPELAVSAEVVEAHPPNIVLLVSDALNADQLSVYGHERNNTPFLLERAEQALIAENAFANSPHSTSSEVSLLSGRSPLETGVFSWPDILLGDDALLHMPALLRELDYRLYFVGLRYYADPFDVNLTRGFHVSGIRSDVAQRPMNLIRPVWGESTAFFLYTIGDRAISRISHLAGQRNLAAELEGIEGRPAAEADQERHAIFREILAEAPEPFFAQVHLLGTHGPSYAPWKRHFADEHDPEAPNPLNWVPEEQLDNGTFDESLHTEHVQNLRDDMILLFDEFVEEVFGILEARGIADNTIVVVTSDHTFRHNVNRRIPLLFFFPGGEHAGRVSENTQLLDIAPTLLSEIGVPRPEWMEGHSLIAGPLDRLRPIYSSMVDLSTEGEGERQRVSPIRRVIAPPFYDMNHLNVVIGQYFWRLDMQTGEVRQTEIPGHTAPLPADALPSGEEAAGMLYERARRYELPLAWKGD